MDGVQVAIVGISMVFFVLGILASVIWLIGLVFREAEVEKPKKVLVPVASPRETVTGKRVDPETVVAITAAISAYLGGRKFRIVSVQPARMSPWKEAGLLRLMRRYGR
jgi:sodium pump decarboxylase gamma subunit